MLLSRKDACVARAGVRQMKLKWGDKKTQVIPRMRRMSTPTSHFYFVIFFFSLFESGSNDLSLNFLSINLYSNFYKYEMSNQNSVLKDNSVHKKWISLVRLFLYFLDKVWRVSFQLRHIIKVSLLIWNFVSEKVQLITNQRK